MGPYRYEHFSLKHVPEQLRFRQGPRPGEQMPEFTLQTTDGEWIRRSDFLGWKPLLLVFASITCPLTRASAPILKRLYDELGEEIEFLTVYVREAHPGQRYPQPLHSDRKLEHARALQARDELPWPVAVDESNGRLHRALDGKMNAVYLMDPTGRIVFRALTATDARALRQAMYAVIAGQPVRRPERQPWMMPLLRAIAHTRETLLLAGEGAAKDFAKVTPPLAVAALGLLALTTFLVSRAFHSRK